MGKFQLILEMGDRFEYVESREHFKGDRRSKGLKMRIKRICSEDIEEIDLAL